MKKFKFAAIVCTATILLAGCQNKETLPSLIKKYPREMVVAFFKTGMLKVKNFDESKMLKTFQDNGAVPSNENQMKDFIINPLPPCETQRHNECGGMSSGYVMRFYGENVTGEEIYSQIREKNPDGTINPRPLKNFLDTKTSYRVYACRGNIEALKKVVSKNIPVIVLINCTGGWHYVPVVGFDEEFIFIQNSVPSFRNVEGCPYNRKETYANFEKLWNVILPESGNLMYIVQRYPVSE